jgi:two-component system cell cycle response regulator
MSQEPNGKFDILIADDNPQILELLEAYLEPLPLRTRTARDGQQVLDAVEERAPDLILLDVMMPKRSGFEVCRSLKQDQRFRHIGIILVTALNELGDMERATECGADEFISKPVNKLVLMAKVRQLLKIDQPEPS